jgi:hypothetical protein
VEVVDAEEGNVDELRVLVTELLALSERIKKKSKNMEGTCLA